MTGFDCRIPMQSSAWTKSELRFRPRIQKLRRPRVTGPEAVGNKLVYHFAKAIEIRGASAFFGGVPFQGFCV